MNEPTKDDWLDYLDGATEPLQKLHKKLRRWRNQGHATEQDLADAAAAIAAIREIYRRRGLPAFDIDSRATRKQNRERK